MVEQSITRDYFFKMVPSADFSATGMDRPGQMPDLDLKALRRVDWRFLLPRTHFRHIAYVGPRDDVLLEALNFFSQFCDRVAPSCMEISPQEAVHDLLVLRQSNGLGIEKALELLKPDGCLYWEIDRTNAIRKRLRNHQSNHKYQWRIHHYDYYINLLKTLGLTNVETYWHRPNFRGCVDMIPLNGGTALKYIFSRANSGLKSKSKSMLGQFFYKTGLLPYLLTCISVIACKHHRIK